MAIELRYELQEADLQTALALTPGTLATRLRWPVLGVIVLVSAIVEWIVREPDQLYLGALAGIGVSALVFWVPSFLSRSQVHRAFRKLSVTARTFRTRLTADNFRVEDGDRRTLSLPWDEVSSGVRHAAGICLYVGLQTFPLPLRALASADEAAAFLGEKLGPRFHRRPVVLDWEMAANVGVWLAAAVAGVLYSLD